MIVMKGFRMQKYYLKSLFLLGLWIIISCVNQGSSKKTATSNDSIKTTIKDNSYLESVYYRFPTPNEIFGFINNEKLKFDQSLLNKSENAEKYLDSKTQTLGLGLYVSDLAYITLFEAYNKSIEYYSLIHNLSEKVRITSAYDLTVAKRIEKNLLNLDSLKSISVDSYSSMVEYLIVNNREKTLALIASGAYIECFYIAFNLAGKYSKNNPMIAKIVDLKFAFENLFSYLQIYSDDEAVKSVALQFGKLNSLFGKLKEASSGKTTVRQDANGNLILGGGSKLVLDENSFNNIKNEVFRLRNEVMNTF
jgi:hypothetical protein